MLFLLSCSFTFDPVAVVATAVAPNCENALNTCPSYAPSWVDASCPAGARCVTFVNECTTPTAIAYNIGCNGNGTAGAPQCACTDGPVLAAGGGVASFVITDANYASCLPSWTPACLTAGLAVIANPTTASCTAGTRVEFTAGNLGDPYAGFDSYDLDVEKDWYSVPVSMAPSLPCAVDTANHDCRPLWCASATCPDAYATPTTGGCPDGRSPQAGCQDTFSGANGGHGPAGYVVTFCPATGTSCQDATPC